MSLFSWFTRKSKQPVARARPAPATTAQPQGAAAAAVARAGKPLLEPQQPPTSSEQMAGRKNERMERRELLYTVVRDAMVRAGVLSAGYKFKVLSLDQRGAQFLVMMDLAPEYSRDMARLAEIEALIAQAARSRFDILVTAVYWRTNEQISTGVQVRPASTPAPAPAVAAPVAVSTAAASPIIAAAPRPAPTQPQGPVLPSRPVPLVPPAPPRVASRFEPIEADEVAAFKQALSSAAARSASAAQPALGVTTRSGPLLPQNPASTGFEDTVMPDHDGRSPDLSSTQYGDLR